MKYKYNNLVPLNNDVKCVRFHFLGHWVLEEGIIFKLTLIINRFLGVTYQTISIHQHKVEFLTFAKCIELYTPRLLYNIFFYVSADSHYSL